MSDLREPSEQPESERDRRRTNIVLLAFFGLVMGIGIWLVNALVDARNADECITQHRRNCNPIEAPPR
ncbi:MAG: hypothetical protein QOC56_512 [Alphaproteobacteria bacterium]|jgi:hypothetical protein|nr:hypothetical protein [Alphaproteobacteria bacterium]